MKTNNAEELVLTLDERELLEVPTPLMSEVSELWHSAARTLSHKLVECAKVKRSCGDLLDPDGAENAWRLARELLQLADILRRLPDMHPEFSAGARNSCISRIISISRETQEMLKDFNSTYLHA